MNKTKVTRIHDEDYFFFKKLAPKAKNSKEMFKAVRQFTSEGKEMRDVKNEIQKLGELMYGKFVWPKMSKQKR